MIAIHVAENRKHSAAVAADFVRACTERGLVVGGCGSADSDRLSIPLADRDSNVVVAVGGDGTVLQGAVHALAMNAAVVGINTGRVGFLAEVEPEDVDALAELLSSPGFNTTKRMSLCATVNGVTTVGLNDVVVEKTTSQHMVAMDIAVDGEGFLTYRCDGVIVSTPTGSSAYTLSAGGPLIDTRLEAMVITPVAPYSLFRAAVVISPDSHVECKIIHNRPAGVSVDGRPIGQLQPGESVVITRGPDIEMVDFSFRSYPETLKRKLRLHEGLEGVLSWDADA